MDIGAQKQDGVMVFTLTGRLDAQTAPEAEEAIKGWLADGELKLVGDLSGLDYISSAGLRVLLMTAKALQRAGGRLCLFGLQASVKQVFDIAGFSSIIPLAASRDEALATVTS